MRSFPRSSDPFTTIERQASNVAASIAPDVREAADLLLRGLPAGALFDRIRKQTSRNWVIAALLGHAAQVRSLRAKGLIGKPSDEGFVEAPIEILENSERDQPDLFSVPFVDALNVFRGEVPDLQFVIDGLLSEAQRRLALPENDPESQIVSVIERAGSIVSRRLQVGGEPVSREVANRAVARIAGDISVRQLDTSTRTTVMQAYNSGSANQIRRSIDVVPVMELSEIRDKRTRGNRSGENPDAGPHYQMDGFAAPTDDEVWSIIMPPNGWNCRAHVRGVSVAECRRRRWIIETPFGEVVDAARMRSQFRRQWAFITSGAYPDPGFGLAA